MSRNLDCRLAVALVGALCGLLLLHPAVGAAQSSDTVGRGNGQDGALVVSAGADRVIAPSDYAGLAADLAAGSSALEVDDASGFSSGDAVLVVQTQLPLDVANAVPDADPVMLDTLEIGHFEIRRIASVSANTITLAAALTRGYLAPGAQVVRLREYTDVTVASGAAFSASPWNGVSGGVLAFVATGTVSVAGRLEADGQGFRGGESSNSDCLLGCDSPARERCQGGDGTGGVGEGLEINPGGNPNDDEYGANACGIGNRDLGGGGGGNPRAGGGGGGNGGAGGVGGADPTLGGVPGVAGSLVSGLLPDRLSFGGGGGGGQTTVGFTEGDGASGGGAVFVHCRTMVVDATGWVSAHGTSATDVDALIGGQAQGGGGGGAGGMVIVSATEAVRCESAGGIAANGGDGASFQTAATAGGGGGGGGGGRVCLLRRTDACDGVTDPGAAGTGLMGGVAVVTARDGASGMAGAPCELRSSDCNGDAACTDVSRPICGARSGICRPCASDGQCAARDADLPHCVTTGARAGECVRCVEASDCADGNECTSERCTDAFTCLNAPEAAGEACSGGVCDGDAAEPACVMCTEDSHCTSPATCNAATNTCSCETDAQCDDSNECTADACNTTCENAPIAAGTACTGGVCSGRAENPRCVECNSDSDCPGLLTCDTGTNTCGCRIDAQCDDGNRCTSDSCNDDGTCTNAPQSRGEVCEGGFCDGSTSDPLCVSCTEDAHCPGAQTCNLATSTCSCSVAADCDDGNECTTEACTASTCEYTAAAAGASCVGGVCNGDATEPVCVQCASDAQCAGGQVCHLESGTCRCDSAADCDDGNECTAERCRARACVTEAAPLEQACTGGFCSGPGAAPRCQMCTRDAHCANGQTCDVATGSCHCVADADCDDGASCTSDRCVDSVCERSAIAEGSACEGAAGICNGDRPIPQCVECLLDSECANGRCNPATNRCEAAAPDAGPFDGGVADAGTSAGGISGGGACSVGRRGAPARGGLWVLLAGLVLGLRRRR